MRSKPDMTVTVNGPLRLAEEATRAVFGENADLGPVMPLAPLPLLLLKDKWPAPGDSPCTVALNLPGQEDLETGRAVSVALDVNRVTILHEGKAVGYAIRTNDLGLDAIRAYNSAAELHRRRMAH